MNQNLIDINVENNSDSIIPDNPQNNFGLSLADYQSMVDKLLHGQEDLFEKVFLSQFSESMNYLKSNYKVNHEIAYDLTMNALLDFRKKILENKITYGNLRYLFTKMVTQYYLKSTEKDKKEVEGSFDFYSLFSDEYDGEYETQVVALKKAWSEMNDTEKNLLEDFYYNNIPLNKIAERENKTDIALRKQKQRSIDKLRSIFFLNYSI